MRGRKQDAMSPAAPPSFACPSSKRPKAAKLMGRTGSFEHKRSHRRVTSVWYMCGINRAGGWSQCHEAALTCMEKSVVTQPTCTLAGTVSQCPVSCWICLRLLGVIQPSLSSSLSSSSFSSSSAPSPSSEIWHSSVLLEMLCVFCRDGQLMLCTPRSRDAGQ